MRTLALIVVSLAAVLCSAEPPEADVRLSPDDIIVLIASDLSRLPPDQAPYTRYATVRMGTTAQERDDLAKLGTAHLHELSSTRGHFPLLTEEQAANGALGVVRVGPLLRFQPRWFGKTFEEQWERLGRVEPYWHGVDFLPAGQEIEKKFGYYFDAAGNAYREAGPGREWRTTEVRKVKSETAVQKRGFFLRTKAGLDAFKAIQAVMVQPGKIPGTDTPVVDVDWFHGQTSADDGRDPGYRKFCGYEDLKGYEKLIGFVRDPKLVDEAFLTQIRAAVGLSTVTNKREVTRRVVHHDKPVGHYFFTLDSNITRAKNRAKANAITTLGDDYEAQAIEALGHRPNGFILKGLFDVPAGKAQDVAPDFIARDGTAPFTDPRVHNGLCLRCHTKGYKPVKDWFRNILNSPPNFAAILDYKELQVLQEQYVTTRLEPKLELAEKIYADALHDVTAWKPEEYAEAIGWNWKVYVEDGVNVDMAARRLGVTQEVFQGALMGKPLAAKLQAEGKKAEEIDAAVKAWVLTHDPMLAVYRPTKEFPNGKESIPAVIWQDTFHRAADVIHGTARPYEVKEIEK